MLTERAKRRIDSQQLCNFTALDKQTKHELMVNKRRRMYTSRHVTTDGRGGGAVPGSGVVARPACPACGVDALGAGRLSALSAPLCTLTLCPHQAATHTRHGVRGP